jgi:hypothetical protein
MAKGARPAGDKMPDWVGVRVGSELGQGVTIQQQWTDSVMVMVSNGSSGMTYRADPADCRRMGEWLLRAADRMESRE